MDDVVKRQLGFKILLSVFLKSCLQMNLQYSEFWGPGGLKCCVHSSTSQSDGNSEFMSSRPALISVCLLIERVRSSAVQSVRTHNHVFCGDTKETIQLEQLSTPCYFELGAHKVRIVFVYLIHCLFTFHSLISCPYHSLISFEDCLSAVHLVLSL